jgi:hypothetical protein
MAKYLFILLPVFCVLLVAADGMNLAVQLLQFGWWRELMIVLSAFGLSIFGNRGMNELCSEEIYFWTFLNTGIWLFGLAIVWTHRRKLSSC